MVDVDIALSLAELSGDLELCALFRARLRRQPHPRRHRHTITRLGNLAWEHRLGIATRGVVPVDHADSVHYATMDYATIWPILERLELGPQDVFVDVGSGKGRVLCCAARRRVKAVHGVDLCEDLCADARENAERLRGRRTPISVSAGFAGDFDYTDATVLFLFDPFGAVTLATLLERIRRQARGSVRFAYANPSQDHIFRSQDWLEPVEYWDSAVTRAEHSVAFYRSR